MWVCPKIMDQTHVVIMGLFENGNGRTCEPGSKIYDEPRGRNDEKGINPFPLPEPGPERDQILNKAFAAHEYWTDGQEKVTSWRDEALVSQQRGLPVTQHIFLEKLPRLLTLKSINLQDLRRFNKRKFGEGWYDLTRAEMEAYRVESWEPPHEDMEHYCIHNLELCLLGGGNIRNLKLAGFEEIIDQVQLRDIFNGMPMGPTLHADLSSLRSLTLELTHEGDSGMASAMLRDVQNSWLQGVMFDWLRTVSTALPIAKLDTSNIPRAPSAVVLVSYESAVDISP